MGQTETSSGGETGIVWGAHDGAQTSTGRAGARLRALGEWCESARHPHGVGSTRARSCRTLLRPFRGGGARRGPEGLDFTGYDFALAGEPHAGATTRSAMTIDHVDG